MDYSKQKELEKAFYFRLLAVILVLVTFFASFISFWVLGLLKYSSNDIALFASDFAWSIRVTSFMAFYYLLKKGLL